MGHPWSSTASLPLKNGGLEDKPFLLGVGIFSGFILNFRGGIWE